MYDHYVKFEKYGTVHRGKGKAPTVGHRETEAVLIWGGRDGLISMLQSFLFVLSSAPSGPLLSG